ncbi:hypothetical protein LPB86_17530 [Pedobacter sp. MC2016-14]|uniref:hypothetical protein n=1 Tax=Pedobacter sp. MC2016-14 TaxID=2897327 RepID=UPI001E5FED27|nr:hypothetical protein [Pedobacter sp. MC2016-14]MCD0490046.1 hypothetical protein [Pedobacter sp. MC2016-14]
MKLKLIFLISIFIVATTQSFAGWYKCYNFSGFIGAYPITLSFQHAEGYFGESAKKKYNVIGVYKYNKFNTPIRFEGIFNPVTKQVELFEIGTNASVTATFKLNFSGTQLVGNWNDSKNTLTVTLTLTNRLFDQPDIAFNGIEIIQYPSLDKYYFVGVYNKNQKSEAYMSALKIINKETNKTFQTLNFENIDTPTGTLMTIIYDNVTTNKGYNFIISNSIGRVGGYLTVNYHPKKKMFVLNPEPVAEGPN